MGIIMGLSLICKLSSNDNSKNDGKFYLINYIIYNKYVYIYYLYYFYFLFFNLFVY